ncbi:MAG TPA: hypothetical protein VHZ03_13560 [Trebonia sp.]|nr:hypothetical protein [Trebonia sp.]
MLGAAGDVWLAIPPALADGLVEAELAGCTPPAVAGDVTPVVARVPCPADDGMLPAVA